MRKNVDRATTNGGFPLPPEGEPVRLLASHHDACDGETRLHLPSVVPPRAVRRVVCQRCEEAYEPHAIAEVADSPRRSLRSPSWLTPPSWLPSPSWRWLSLPVAAVAVVGGLTLIQGDGDETPTATAPTAAPAGEAVGSKQAANVPADARLVSASTFQVALPPGWERTTPSGGATFAAAAPGGDADATLWIERDPKLDFAEFEARSLAQLKSLAGSAGVVERNAGPTPETTSITIAPTSAPDGAPNYQVLLRASGNNWYYLATTSQPGASSEAIEGVELIRGSFLPQGAAR
jgi:hypothetical protein